MHLRNFKTFTRLCLVCFGLCFAGTLSSQLYENVTPTKSDQLTKGIVFEIKSEKLTQLSQSKSNTLEIALPSMGQDEFLLDLEPIRIHSDGFSVVEKSKTGEKTIDYKTGQYYKGQLKGNNNSQAIIAIHENEISGVITYGAKKFNLGKLRDSDKHILYESSALKEVGKMSCGTLPNYDSVIETAEEKQKMTGCTVPVDIYFECDHQMYQNFNSNTAGVTNYVNTLFAEVAVLYAAENITVQLSQVTVWSNNDNYPSGSAALTEFANDLNASGFNGDLAHLLTNDTGSNGGVAYVDQLCGAFPYSYSDILNTTESVPTYSWDVQVVTHELGHNFGSSHTHDCVWGPNNNQQIDDCGSIVLGGGTCYNPNSPIVPSGGGSIMSYCHLNAVGINFNVGFGPEPGDLIRSKHSTCMCDNSTCDTALEITTSGTYSAQPSSGNGANSPQAAHADWFVFTPSSPGTIDVQSCNEGVDTRLFIYTGTCNNLSLVANSDDDCTSSGSSNYASQVNSHAVVAGTSYLIEWDSRWSTAAFDWQFTFTPTTGGPTATITCPQDHMAENHCLPSDYDPAATGTAIGSAGTTVTYSDQFSTTDCVQIVDRTWTATHTNGSSATCSQYIDLDDNTAPIVQSCPTTISVTSDTNCQAVVSWNAPTASDACSSSVTMTTTHTPGSSFAVGSYSVIYLFTDSCNNTSNCSFAIHVLDGCSGTGGGNNGNLDPCDGINVLLTGNITSETHSAEEELNANGTVHNGHNPILKAGQEMELLPGFEVKAGATLEALIEDCQN